MWRPMRLTNICTFDLANEFFARQMEALSRIVGQYPAITLGEPYQNELVPEYWSVDITGPIIQRDDHELELGIDQPPILGLDGKPVDFES